MYTIFDSQDYLATLYGHCETAQYLIASGAMLEDKNHFLDTALHNASAHDGSVKMVNLLLDTKADLESVNKYGFTPLLAAAYKGQPGTTRLLLDRGANVHVHATTSKGRTTAPASLELVLVADVQLMKTCRRGSTPLHLAARAGQLTTAEALVKSGMDVNVTTSGGWRPLYYAAWRGQVDVVTFLA